MADKLPGIRERSPGVWEVRVHVSQDPATGRVRQVSRTYRADDPRPGAGIRGAKALHAKLLTEVRQGRYGGTQATFGLLLDEWLKFGSKRWAPQTASENRRKVTTIIRPALGAIRLDRLTPHDLNSFYVSRQEAGDSRRSVVHYREIISGACREGVNRGWLEKNPSDRTMRLSVSRDRLPVPTGSEIAAIIKQAEARRAGAADLPAIVTVAALSGMRRGELCGLRFSDVDWLDSIVHVRRSIWQVGKDVGEKPPKSHQVRAVSVPPLVIDVLRRALEDYEATAAMLEVEPSPDAYVWSGADDHSTPLKPNAVTLAFGRVVRRAGMSYRFHDLRHFAGTEMVARGVDLRTAADQLGHADPTVTANIYAGGRLERRAEAAALLGQALTPGAANPPTEAGGEGMDHD